MAIGLADTAATAQTETASSGATVEEIVVTAQKRAEKLQDVPVSVTALSARDLEQAGLTSPAELNQLVVGLNIGVAAGATLTPFLRGIGNNTVVVGNEASTAVYVDGVYFPRLTASFFELADIDRVEVLEGPQGTLFGRNASGGLINIITDTSSLDNYELRAAVGYANYDTLTEKLYVSAPVSDNVAGSISIFRSDQGDGWGRNLANGAPAYYDNPTILRTKWLFNVTDKLSVTASADYFHDDNNMGEPASTVPGTLVGLPGFYLAPPYNLPERAIGNMGFYNEYSFVAPRDREEGYGGSVRIDYDLDFAKLSSISALRQQNQAVYSDGAYAGVPALVYAQFEKTRTFSEELQIASEKGSNFDWIAGFYYLNEYAGYFPVSITGPGVAEEVFGGAFGPVLPVGTTVNLFGGQRVEDYAVYGQATYHVLPDTNLTLGARYTYDHVEGHGATDVVIPGILTGELGSTNASTNFYKPTFKVALDHHFTDDLMSYVSFSRGFKAGTYNTLPLTLPAVKPEVVDAIELGAKSTWLDRRLQLNGAFFYYHINDPQDQEIVNHVAFLTNADAAEIKGADLSGQFALTHGLTARFGAEYLDAHYTSFPNAPYYTPLLASPYGSTSFAADASGNQLVDAPRFVFNFGMNYAMETSVGIFDANANFSYNGGFKWNPDNVIRQKAYELVDASLTYTPVDHDNWQVRLWGKNITGEKYTSFVLEQAGPAGFSYAPAPPATYGVELSYRFDAPR
jgi:iron complex outermembrane receptor protein